MNNNHWQDPWCEVPKELHTELESQLNPAMILLPKSNPRELSPQDMIEQGQAVAARDWGDGGRITGIRRIRKT